jgi:hypothetical protein
MKMDTLTRKEELQGMIDSRTNQIAEGVSLATQGVIESEINAFKAEIAQIEEAEQNEAAQQVRIQAQEEKVESITLPHNFDDVFGDPRANEMIIEVVKQFQLKAYEDHNAEVDRINEGWKNKLDEITSEWTAKKTQLQEENMALSLRITDLEDMLEEKIEDNYKAHGTINELALEKDDSDSKRDAAVKQFEEAQAEIAQLKSWNNDLREQAAQGVRKAIDIIDISGSDKLDQLIKLSEEEKKRKSIEERANLGLARYAAMMPDVVAPPIALEVPTFQLDQAYDTNLQLDSGTTKQGDADHQEVTAPNSFPTEGEVQTVPAPVASGVSSEDGETVSRQEFEALKATVNDLCRVCDIAEVA